MNTNKQEERMKVMSNQIQVLKPEKLDIIQSAKKKAIFLDLDGTFWDRQIVPN